MNAAWGTVPGLSIGFVVLLHKFYRFRGLGVLVNPYSALFLGLVTATSAASYAGLDAVLGEVGFDWLKILGASAFGPGATALGRLPRLRRASDHIGGTGAVKDLQGVKAANILFKLICERIGDRMDDELWRMANRYDLQLIQDTVRNLIQNERVLHNLTDDEASGVLQELGKFRTTGNGRKDVNTRYMALHRAIAVCSFIQVRSRLAHHYARLRP